MELKRDRYGVSPRCGGGLRPSKGDVSGLCHFCMKREAIREMVGGIADQPVTFNLCKECADEKEKVDKRGNNLLDLQHQDTAKLCIGCGVCCYILHARVTESEADRIIKEQKINKDDFAIHTEIGKCLYPDSYTIKTPCMFLLGNPLGRWTACRIYGQFRPAVCVSYMCKIAMRYQMGTVCLGEAKYSLRSAILAGDLSIFNWTSSDQEAKILIASHVATMANQLRKDNVPEDQIKMAMASWITPRYLLKSALDELALDMHFATHDRGDDDPLVFFTKDEISNLEKLPQRSVIEQVITRVLSTVRNYFVSENRQVDHYPEVDEEQIEKLKESV